MGLARKDLGRDEEIVVEVRSHKGALTFPLLFLLLCGLGAGAVIAFGHTLPLLGRQIAASALGAVGMVVFFTGYFRWRSRRIALTTQRVVVTTGSFGTTSEQVRLERILEVHLDRRFFERLAGRGSVILDIEDGPPLFIDRLRRPEAFQRLIVRQMSGGAFEGVDEGVEGVRRPSPGPQVTVVYEDDPTPPAGTPAVSSTHAASLFARLDELDGLEASGVLSRQEAEERRRQLTEGI